MHRTTVRTAAARFLSSNFNTQSLRLTSVTIATTFGRAIQMSSNSFNHLNAKCLLHTTPLRWQFEPGYPTEPCRPYTDQEWNKIRQAMGLVTNDEEENTSQGQVNSNNTGIKVNPPMVVLVSGSPGGGKSSSVEHIFDLHHQLDANSFKSTDVWPSRSSFSVVDFDHMRSFHDQYVKYAHQPLRDLDMVISTVPSQLTEVSQDSIEQPSYQSYRELVSWFNNGTRFEEIMFRCNIPGRGLIPELISKRKSFILESVLDNEGSYEFVKYIMKEGYRIVLVHVHTPTEKAIERAEKRAYQTGRWSGEQFIRSREAGLKEWFVQLANLVLAPSTFSKTDLPHYVYFLDNSVDNQQARMVFASNSLSVSNKIPMRNDPHLQSIWGEYRLYQIIVREMAREVCQWLIPRVEDRYTSLKFDSSNSSSTTTSSSIPSSSSFNQQVNQSNAFEFCLAGGLFKTLLTGLSPRDIDLFPCTDSDAIALKSFLMAHHHVSQIDHCSMFQTKWLLCVPGSHCPVHRPRNQMSHIPPISCANVVLEVATRCDPPDLKQKLERFDIALSAVGVRVRIQPQQEPSNNGASISPSSNTSSSWQFEILESYIHPNFWPSFIRAEPLLILPLPNKPYLLATAERCIRYADELGWDLPRSQLDHLRAEYTQIIGQLVSSLDFNSNRVPKHSIESPSSMKEWLLNNYLAVSQGGKAKQRVIDEFHLTLPPDMQNECISMIEPDTSLSRSLNNSVPQIDVGNLDKISLSVLTNLSLVPSSCTPLLLLRHGHRDLNQHDQTVQLNQEGQVASLALGRMLKLTGFYPSILISSPWDRCKETLELIKQGAEWKDVPIQTDSLLQPSAPWITDGNEALESYERLKQEFFNAQIRGIDLPPGVMNTQEGVRKILDLCLPHAPDPDSSGHASLSSSYPIHVCVSHDANLVVLIGWLMCQSHAFNKSNWIDFLEGVVLWQSFEGKLFVAWRGIVHQVLG